MRVIRHKTALATDRDAPRYLTLVTIVGSLMSQPLLRIQGVIQGVGTIFKVHG